VVNVTGGMVHFLGFGFARDNGRFWAEVESISPLTKGRSTLSSRSKRGSRGVLPEIAYASGAAVLYRASVLQKVGLLDPFLFLYHEDLELGWRIRLCGFKNVLCVDSVAYHDYEFKRSIQKFYWMERNRILVHFSHLRWRTLALLAIPLLLAEVGLIVFALKGGWIKEKVLVYLSLLNPRSWTYVAKKRRESQLLRRVSDREIVRLWTGKIEHQQTKSLFVDGFVNPILSALWAVIRFFVPTT
jgi:GT2 family glycosyltransferase